MLVRSSSGELWRSIECCILWRLVYDDLRAELWSDSHHAIGVRRRSGCMQHNGLDFGHDNGMPDNCTHGDVDQWTCCRDRERGCRDSGRIIHFRRYELVHKPNDDG